MRKDIRQWATRAMLALSVLFFLVGNASAQLVVDSFAENYAALGLGYPTHVVPTLDGRVYVATSDNKVARLLADGSLDGSFAIGIASVQFGTNAVSISSLLLQPDGKVLVGGNFASFSGASVYGLVRLDQSGSIDSAYGAGALGGNQRVYDLALDQSGRLLVGRWGGIERWNQDGTRDESFLVRVNISGTPNVSNIHVRIDGRIVIFGNFQWVGGQLGTMQGWTTRRNIAQLLPDGTVDQSFLVGEPDLTHVPELYGILPHFDGALLLLGRFRTSTNSGIPVLRIRNDNGIDWSFTADISPKVPATPVLDKPVAFLQTDGKVVLAVGNNWGERGRRLIRMLPDGSLDASFDMPADVVVATSGFTGSVGIHSTAVQADGKILVAGNYQEILGVARAGLARLSDDTLNCAP